MNASPSQVIETGIRALDLYSPLLRGGRLSVRGTPGAGQVVLVFEVAHNLASKMGARAVFHTPEAEQFRRGLRESRVEADVTPAEAPSRVDLLVDGDVLATIVLGDDMTADSWAILTVGLLKTGQMPAIDPTLSGTRAELGEHGLVAERARKAVAQATGVRAGGVLAFTRQWFHVAEPWTGQAAEYSSLEETLAGIRRFLGD